MSMMASAVSSRLLSKCRHPQKLIKITSSPTTTIIQKKRMTSSPCTTIRFVSSSCGALQKEFSMSLLQKRISQRFPLEKQKRYSTIALSTNVTNSWNNNELPSSSKTASSSLSLTLHQKSYYTSNSHSYYKKFKLDALPFTISPEEAISSFYNWSYNDQGLRYILNTSSVRVSAAYAPVWSFDINIRFVTLNPKTKQKQYHIKPKLFATAYGPKQNVIHVPGLSVYAGHSYRRSLINPIVETSLVFMGDKTVPFQSWMLQQMVFRGQVLDVYPDPWNATKGRAFAVLEEELQKMAQDGIEEEISGECRVETQLLSSRRVYMPIFVFDYSVFGVEYKAFVSGCDAAVGVSGVSHQVFSSSFLSRGQQSARLASSSFLQGVQMARRTVGDLPLIGFFNSVLRLMVKTLSRFHIIGIVGGGIYVAFMKIIRPWMQDRSETAEWERQREHEAFSKGGRWVDDHTDDFVDDGSARLYFAKNKDRILHYLSGDTAADRHEEGDFDWYKQWEEWARKQWEEEQQRQWQRYKEQSRNEWWNQEQSQQQQQQQEYKRTQRQQQKQQTQTKKKKTYQWDFDPNDPYSVLGIQRSPVLTKADVSKAFRREMLKHHPDTQAGATPEEKERSVERSKLITEAYRKIKAQMK